MAEAAGYGGWCVSSDSVSFLPPFHDSEFVAREAGGSILESLCGSCEQLDGADPTDEALRVVSLLTPPELLRL
jgi:hypothetical protein